MTRNALIAVVATAAIALAGCGDDKKDSNKQLSYSGFVSEANKVCKDQDAKIDPISNKLTGQADNDAPIYEELIPKLEDARDDFAELKPPDELKPDFDKVVSLIDAQIQGAKTAQSAAQTGDQEAYDAAIAELRPLSAQTEEAQSKLGAADCLED